MIYRINIQYKKPLLFIILTNCLRNKDLLKNENLIHPEQ